MRNIYRIVYKDVCEVWVEVDGNTISRVLAATAFSLAGKQLDNLPKPAYVESKLIVRDDS